VISAYILVISGVVLITLLVIALLWGWRQHQELLEERTYWQQQREQSNTHALPPLFLATAAALDTGLLLIDRNQRICFANQAVRGLLSSTLDPLEGQSLITVVRDYQADMVVRTALDRGEVQSTTLRPVLSSRTLRITCYPIEGGETYNAIVLLNDVTKLAQLQRARREMVANVSHELRTPLASIKLLVETLQSEPPPPIAQRMLGQIDDELNAVTHLVDELRELSQIESGRMVMQLRPTNLAEIVQHTATRLYAQAERRQLKVLTDIAPDLPPALIDGERIEQVLLNLVNNALKFTPAGGTIKLIVRLAKAEKTSPHSRLAQELKRMGQNQALLIAVVDTGIGIPLEDQERVFERFYKVDRARTRNHGGTGLGLAIAKHLVERHDGRIWVESEEGKGSTFAILLPCAETEVQAS
jgi:two-component system phosphate regulon sensor histidine kinase PhoR